MPGRKYSAGNLYRYGFNGKENDNEVKGEGNQQDYGLRIYDPRLVRFLSVDPLTRDYPWYTPYQFAGNSPIANIDLDGAEPKSAGKEEGEVQNTTETKYAPSDCNCAESEGYEENKSWVWHNGGLPLKNNKKTESGWFERKNYNALNSGTLSTSIGYLSLSASAIKELGGFEKAQELLSSGKFEAIYNGEKKVWSLKFFGNKNVNAEWVAQEKTAFAGKAAKNLNTLKWVKGAGTVFNVAGILVTGIEIANNKGKVSVENGYDLALGGIAFIPGGGWFVSGMGFLSKEYLKLVDKVLPMPGPEQIDSPIQVPEKIKKLNSNPSSGNSSM